MKLALFLALACASSLAASPITISNNALIYGFGGTQIHAAASANYDDYTGVGTAPLSRSFQADAIGYTVGPVRPGFLALSTYGIDMSGTGSGRIGDAVLSCAEFGCLPYGNVVLPFMLGTEFAIHVEAYAHNFHGEGGSGEIQFDFSLHDLNSDRLGAAVIIYDPLEPTLTHMPEPSTWATLGIGFGFLLFRKFRQH